MSEAHDFRNHVTKLSGTARILHGRHAQGKLICYEHCFPNTTEMGRFAQQCGPCPPLASILHCGLDAMI